MAPQLRVPGGGVAARDEIGDETLLAGDVLAGQHAGVAHVRMAGEGRLDLAQLDPVATDLHLLIEAAEELQGAVRPVAGAVAGAVEPSAGIAAERIGEVALGGERRLARIAGRQAAAPDVEVARRAGRGGDQPAIQDVIAGVPDGAAIGDADPAGIDPADRIPVGPDRGLGRAAQADHPGRREALAHQVRERQGDPVAGEEHQPQAAPREVRHPREQRHELLQGGGRRIPERDRLVAQQPHQALRLVEVGRGGDVDRSAGGEEAEDVVHREVEGESEVTNSTRSAGPTWNVSVHPIDQVDHRPVAAP